MAWHRAGDHGWATAMNKTEWFQIYYTMNPGSRQDLTSENYRI